MGGEREATLEVTTKAAGTTLTGKAKQILRFHENKGEIHFHDDEIKLKAAIPVAEWYTIFRVLNTMKNVTYIDSTNWTIIKFKPNYDPKNGLADIKVTLQAVKVGSNLASLQKFSR